jgi:hypothetical protein
MEEPYKQTDEDRKEQGRPLLSSTPKDKDRIFARCQKDHLASPALCPKMNISCYNSSFSPPKTHFLHKPTHFEQALQLFRKYENTSSLRLPAITDKTQYQNLFNGEPHSKIVRSTAKESWFLKGEWPEQPVSSYQVTFGLFRKISRGRRSATATHSTN